MHFTGAMYYGDSTVVAGTKVDAAITPNRIALTWDEDGDRGGLSLEYQEGRFRGKYTYASGETGFAELRKWTDGLDVLLIGPWWYSDDRGIWRFELSPKAEVKPKKKSTPKK